MRRKSGIITGMKEWTRTGCRERRETLETKNKSLKLWYHISKKNTSDDGKDCVYVCYLIYRDTTSIYTWEYELILTRN